jgi:hypothetical protein
MWLGCDEADGTLELSLRGTIPGAPAGGPEAARAFGEAALARELAAEHSCGRWATLGGQA